MKKSAIFIFLLAAVIYVAPAAAQIKTEKQNKTIPVKEKKELKEENKMPCGKLFVDKNGDGYNDNIPDDDGDGIPNCLDQDCRRGKMQKAKKGFSPAMGTVKEAGVSGLNTSKPGLKGRVDKGS